MKVLTIAGCCAAVFLVSCRPHDAAIPSVDGSQEIRVAARYEVRSRAPLLIRGDDKTAEELLLRVPASELGLDLRADPLFYIYDFRSSQPRSTSDLSGLKPVPLTRDLVRYVDDRGDSLSEPIVDSRTSEVIAECPISMKGTLMPICDLTPFRVGPFEVELSVALNDLQKRRAIQSAAFGWLNKHRQRLGTTQHD